MSDTIYAAIELCNKGVESGELSYQVRMVYDPLEHTLTMWYTKALVIPMDFGGFDCNSAEICQHSEKGTSKYTVNACDFLDLLGEYNKEGRLIDVRYGYKIEGSA